MNLSCSPCSQSFSVMCSMTPPGAEPALLTMMSTRPRALCPCSTKFLASASLVRSAGMATTLRPVALAISAAVASSGSLRLAQMATSTPSLASNWAMPLPMPSLPPVTSAVLPLSCRSMESLRLLFVGKPAASLGRGKQVRQRRVHGRRLFTRNGVARARDDEQSRRRHDTLEEDAALETRLVLIADNHQQRDAELLQLRFHLPQRRALELQVEHGLRVAFRRMFGEHARELRKAARILVLESLPHRRIGIFRSGGDDALFREHLPGLGGHRLHRFALRDVGRRAPATAGSGHRDASLRVPHAHMQRRVGAHGMADDVRLRELECIHERDDVVARDVLPVPLGIARHIGRRIAALAVGDAAMRAREMPQLRLPAAIVAGIFVHENDRRALPGLFVIEADAVGSRDVRHQGLTLIHLHTNEMLLHSYATLQAQRGRRTQNARHLFGLGDTRALLGSD